MSVTGRLGSVAAFARWARGEPQWRRFAEVDLAAAGRFVFVCKANICRSAYAAARARLLNVPVASAGIEAWAGMAAAATACRLAARRGVALDAHQSTPFTSLKLQPGDLLVCMETQQAEAVERAAAEAGAQVTLLGLWSRPQRPIIPDPYERSERVWHDCFRIIDSSIARLVAEWRMARRGREGC